MKKFLTTLALAGAIITGAQAQSLLITEINSNGSGGDFFELFNYGTSAVDLGGYLWTDNAAPAYNGANTYTLGSFSLLPGSAVVIVSDAGQNGAGNAAFLANWGLASPPVGMGAYTGPAGGRGLGQNDAVLLWDPSGAFVSGLNYGTTSLTVTNSGGTSTLAPFNRVGGGTSAGGHAGAAGGGTAVQSLIWDPGSSTAAPLYTAASSVGLYGSFANATSAATIGSPGVVPEPSTYALLALAGLGFAAYRIRRRARR